MNDSGPGSLRQAILDANATAGADRIEFNIPGAGVHTISPLSPLPALTDAAGVTIDGYSQPGSSPNTLVAGDNAVIRLELDGSAAGASADGLSVQSSSNLVRGIAVNRFNRGIGIGKGDGNRVAGCFVGTDPAGKAVSPNQIGIGVEGDDSNVVTSTLVGGLDAAGRNIVAGNSQTGVAVGFFTTGTVVAGNFIGTDASGTAALPNTNSGVLVVAAADTLIGGAQKGAGNLISGNGTGVNSGFSLRTTVQGNRIGTDVSGLLPLSNGTGVVSEQDLSDLIGGTAPEARNLISGNRFNGVSISFGAKSVVVQGNLIGTDASGIRPLQNGRNGVSIRLFTSDTVVGGPGAASNVIAFNAGAGVAIGSDPTDTSADNRVSGNSIHDNGGLGIDLGNDGLTSNDPGDGDSGPNGLQNYPVLSAAVSDGISTRIEGSLDSRPGSVFVIELFASPSCDPSGNGEGQTFLGAGSATTDVSGKASFVITVPSGAAGQVVTATATDPDGNTSEFSSCVPAAFGRLPTSVPTLGAQALAALAILLGAVGALVLAKNRLS